MTLLLVLTLVFAPADTLRLEEAYGMAEAHFPRHAEGDLQRAAARLAERNLDARFLPSLGLSGQAVYHSEVASFPFSIPGASMPTVPHDQYRVGVSAEQLVFDGGLVAGQKAVLRVDAAIAAQDAAVASYGLREGVEAAYFGVLLAEAQAASLDAIASDLAARLEQASALAARGVVTASTVDVLRAETIRVAQQRTAAWSRRRAALDVLGELTGRTLPDETALALPASVDAPGARPEHALFALSRQRLDRQSDLAARRARPRVVSFADAAVGRPPGLNLFEDRVTPFFSLGVRVAWPFWDWSVASREREALAIQREVVDARAEAFDQGVRIASAGALRDIEQLEAALATDAEIIALRARIAAEAASRLEQGAATATDYLLELNAEHQARLAQRMHRIQLVQARARLATLTGRPR